MRFFVRALVFVIAFTLIGVAAACSGDDSVDGGEVAVPVAEPSPRPASPQITAIPTDATPAPAITVLPTRDVPDATAVPTVVPTPAATSVPTSIGECPDLAGQTLDIVGVAADDPDGGLVVHDGPGVNAAIVGVFAPDARSIRVLNECVTLEDGSLWREVTGGFTYGWVNAAFLGERINPADQLAATPCDTDTHEVAPEPRADAEVPEGLTVAGITVQSTESCDRVVIELGRDWSFEQLPRSFDLFPSNAVVSSEREDDQAIILFAGIEPAINAQQLKTWTDAATGESNAALLIDHPDGTALWAGWGTGQAAVRFVDTPARIVIDIEQSPSPQGELHGPFGVGPMLFQPIQPNLNGPGVEGPIRIRGWSFGFEGSSFFLLRPWDQSPYQHPSQWGDVILGPAADLPTPKDLVVTPDLSIFSDALVFSTSGYFDYTIAGLPPGGYQIALMPSTGLGCPGAVGQQFRVAETGSDQSVEVAPLAVPFVVTREVDWDNEVALSAVTTVSSLGTDYATEGTCGSP